MGRLECLDEQEAGGGGQYPCWLQRSQYWAENRILCVLDGGDDEERKRARWGLWGGIRGWYRTKE